MDFDSITETITPTASTSLTIGGTGALFIPAGTTAQRPIAPESGYIRFNTSNTVLEYYNGVAIQWQTFGSSTISALSNVSGTGFLTQTSSGVYAARSISGTTDRVTVTNGDGIAGNPAINIATTYAGQNTITTLGTVATGTWNATTIAANRGGTGQTVYAVGDIIFASGTTALSKLSIGSTNTVLTSNGTQPIWSQVLAGNASGTVGVSPTGGGTAWTLVSGSRYRADFVHNLGTTNVVVTLWDTNNNAVVIANELTTLDNNTVRIQVTGNTRTIKVVVVAQGSALVAGGSTPSSVITAKDGVTVSTAATRLNFSGQAVGVVDAGSGTTNITIGSRFTFFANSLDTPVNSDFAVNAISATATDPAFAALNVRSFSNTVEQGVACLVSIPPGATTIIMKLRGRSQTTPGVASVVQPRLYYRRLPNNAAVGAWSAAQELANISIPTNQNFQYSTQTIALSTLGLLADNLYQFEITRRVTGVTGTNLAANYLLAELTIEFA
jgi:hypothetical protein